MELVNIRRPQTAPPLAAGPLQEYLANIRRAHQASTMTLSARYQRVLDGQSAFPDHPSSAEESDTTLRSTSSDSHEDADGKYQQLSIAYLRCLKRLLKKLGQVDSPPPSWSRLLWTTLSRPFSSSTTEKVHSSYLREYEKVNYDKGML